MKRGQRPAAWILAAAASLAAAGAWAETPQAPQNTLPARTLDPAGGALVAPGNAPDVIFLHTGDVIGYLEPCG
jgi:hypothetical protein